MLSNNKIKTKIATSLKVFLDAANNQVVRRRFSEMIFLREQQLTCHNNISVFPAWFIFKTWCFLFDKSLRFDYVLRTCFSFVT